jgi:metallophosphoesterase (TIGR00282 family)
MRILFIGDIVGRPAREYVKEIMPKVKADEGIDCVIANAENAAGGSSITMHIAQELFEAGLDILTSGDHIFKKKEVKEVLDTFPVVRPLNYGNLAWGDGYVVKEINGNRIAVVNLLGRVFMQPVDCPFKAIRELLPALKAKAHIIVVDIHAEATSEKLAMGYFLAGEVSAVLGTHTHIVTADERIIEDYTAYISDVGMTGSYDSILGREKHQIIERFLTNMPLRFNIAQLDIRMQGVIVDIDASTGRAETIRRVEYRKGNI